MFYKHDPGPCPVDDTPHTGCVAPTAAPSTTVRPPRDQPRAPRSLTVRGTVPGAITTGTYRRKDRTP